VRQFRGDAARTVKLMQCAQAVLGRFRAAPVSKGNAMKITTDKFRVPAGHKVSLSRWPTRAESVYQSTAQYHKILADHIGSLSGLQNMLYADNRYAVLFIFQAMDAAGKDGAIKHVMSGVNPQGCQVTCFKHPSAAELQHDFLWRTTRNLPERGNIGIFNRSYYEEVLILRVHPELLLGEGLSGAAGSGDELWEGRYRSIVEFENHLYRNDTRVVKLFLHLSKEEQRKRFLDRIDDPNKNWKLSAPDIEERKFWSRYMDAYERCFVATSTELAPWYVVPADDKDNARLIVSQIILDTLAGLQLRYPISGVEKRDELQKIRVALEAER
jgi:PPK2 family polyphosphate:nucleotide phosphotransferase